MHRGSTPTFQFIVEGLDFETLTDLSIVFAQKGKVILEKRLPDCVIEQPNKINLYLTEKETLIFTTANSEAAYIDVQLKFGYKDQRIISDILKVIIKPILKDGVLNAV